jgi:hypothetical protein
VVSLFEALGLFREPLAGLEPELARIKIALETAALSPSSSLRMRSTACWPCAG